MDHECFIGLLATRSLEQQDVADQSGRSEVWLPWLFRLNGWAR
jgi:hypothetical protein